MRISVLVTLILLAGCVQLPPSPQDIDAKRFAAVPEKAVIYLVRTPMDGPVTGPVTLEAEGGGMITTHPRTYYRWEVTPGKLRIAAMYASVANITFQTQPGRIYFVEQTVTGSRRSGTQMQFLVQIDENRGRMLVSNSQLL